MRSYFIIWFGETFSLIGSGLTSFALGIWVFQKTGSITKFAFISLVGTLPGIIIAPLAGALVDRWKRKAILILSDLGCGIGTLIIVALLLLNRLEIWHLYLILGINSVFSGFQWPAFTAATTLMVHKNQLGRANGMLTFAKSAGQVFSPMIAGALLGLIQLIGILIVDFITFFIAIFTLILVRIQEINKKNMQILSKSSLRKEIKVGLDFIKERHGLLGLLIFFFITNYFVGIISILFTPIILSFRSVSDLGLVLSIGGIGMITGSLIMSAWGGPKRLFFGIFIFQLLNGFYILIIGYIQNSFALFTIIAFLFFLGLPIINSCSQTIWQHKVAPELQGRVMAIRRMIALSSFPLAYLTTGFLIEDILNPILESNTSLSQMVDILLPYCPNKSFGVLFGIMGITTVMLSIIIFIYPRIRKVELELPDFI